MKITLVVRYACQERHFEMEWDDEDVPDLSYPKGAEIFWHLIFHDFLGNFEIKAYDAETGKLIGGYDD